jgi:purine-cytosine permease-like protein
MVQTRIEKINSHINNLKLFVVAFCLFTVLLNTYHINRLKIFSSSLGQLMKTHSTSLTQLNVLNQIKQNRGYATGGKGYEPQFDNYNTTVNTFLTNDKEVVHDEYLMAGLTEK